MPKPLRVNEEIQSRQLRLIDASGKSLGVVSYDQAMWLAWEDGVDLVEVGSNVEPPVTRLLDYGKYQYEQAKAESKGRAHAPEIKEIRLTMKIGRHDFEVKEQQAARWLSEGNRVRVTVTMHGREMIFADKGKELIERMRIVLDATYEMPITRTGNRFSTIVGKKK